MSTARGLISVGFDEVERADQFLADKHLAGIDSQLLLRLLREAPQPDQALLLLIRLLERAPQVAKLFTEDSAQALGLIRLLGASQALGEFLIRHPEQTDVLEESSQTRADKLTANQLRSSLIRAVAADPESPQPVADLATVPEDEPKPVWRLGADLRISYRRQLVRIALEDLCADDPLAQQPFVSQQLADAAGAAIDAALAVVRAEQHPRREETAQVDLAVIGMGKCGARELNYISDVDVVFVHRAPDEMPENTAAELAAVLASGLSKVIGASQKEPALWEIDANLRPEGKDGALSRTVDSHAQYYRRWAHGWEFQALLKARPLAGDLELGAEYIDAVWPTVWQSSAQEGFVANVQAMRRRVFENIPHGQAPREIKLGRGGLRDIEFTVQLLQLVHGRVDENLRMRDTLSAIDALAAGEYMASTDAKAMSRCYRQLRLFEHRIQMMQMRRTHLMPEQETQLRAVSHAVLPPGQARRGTPDELQRTWRSVVREVTSFHEKIFYRPLLSTTAVLSDDEVRLSDESVYARLAALGYRDGAGALRHIEALTQGISRRATLQRRILPMMLGWLAEGVDPDAGLVAFRRLSESLGSSPWYLGMLRDSSVAAERLCHVLSSSRLISDMLEYSPESAKWFGDDDALRPLGFEQLWTEVKNAIARHEGEPAAAVRLARLVRQREMLRVAIADATGLITLPEVSRALSDLDRVLTLGALRAAEIELFASEERAAEFLVVGMGRQGGQEITYGSDMDAMFVHRSLPGVSESVAEKQSLRLAQRVTQLVSKPIKPAIRAELPLQLDADLRPEGKQGPLCRSLDSYAAYYQRWMAMWERQALLRARPVAGSDALADSFMEVVDAVRYGPAPTSSQVREVRRIKARVESERLPRGADPSRQVKLGRGGLSDVEWLVQLLQMQHSAEVPALHTTSTLDALDALVDTELISDESAQTLREAWELCTRVRAALMVWSGRNNDVLPSGRRELEAISRWCGFEDGHAGDFEEHYLRTTRRARQVFEELFYEDL